MAGAGIHPYHQQWPPAGAPPPPAAVSSAAPPHPPPIHHHPPPPPVLVDNHNRPPYDEVQLFLFLSIHIGDSCAVLSRWACLIFVYVEVLICLLFDIQC